MSTTEYSTDAFITFDEDEHQAIQRWLETHGYRYSTNTVCGGCCGMYADEYWVNGIGGKWKKGDLAKFKRYAKRRGISCRAEGYTIEAIEEDL